MWGLGDSFQTFYSMQYAVYIEQCLTYSLREV